jgi:hypothetical protein
MAGAVLYLARTSHVTPPAPTVVVGGMLLMETLRLSPEELP